MQEILFVVLRTVLQTLVPCPLRHDAFGHFDPRPQLQLQLQLTLHLSSESDSIHTLDTQLLPVPYRRQ